jgi:signal transduction histidine kinase
MFEIQEAERRRIARDLHDIVLQDLSGALQGLQAIQVEGTAQGRNADLKPEVEALRAAVGSLRNAVYDLRLEGRQPFVRAVEALVELNRELTPEREITLTVQHDFPPELPDGLGVEVLRMLREALVNTRRHSDARRVEVILSNSREKARVEVADDGRGFNPASIGVGVGLSSMRERVSEIGGKFAVESGPGQGTRVKAEFPL